MHEQAGHFMEQIERWAVNDYFTPNIKAEVILDTLLTPYIPKILKSRYDDIDAVLLAKEMSMIEAQKDEEPENDLGPKVDYVLADKTQNCVYLVELKTTDSSIDAGQLALYASLAEQTRDFGDVLGKRLLAILAKSFHIRLGDPEGWGDTTLEEAWEKIWAKRSRYDPKGKDPKESASYGKMAMDLIKAKGWAWRSDLRSRKYVYTLGQILDHLHGEYGGAGLWGRQVKPIYLLPRLPKDRSSFGKDILLSAFVPYFETEQADTPLAAILNGIYGAADLT